MNEYLHTAIALGLMFGSYIIGKYLGRKEGVEDILGALMNCWGVKAVVIDEDGSVIVTKKDGTEKTIEV